MQKTAVDQATKDYWSTYFKEYGKSWVRDLPRRIKQAARRKTKASKIEGIFAPMAADISNDKTLSIEAAFVGKIDGQKTRALITASFDDDGTMREFEFNQIS